MVDLDDDFFWGSQNSSLMHGCSGRSGDCGVKWAASASEPEERLFDD